MFLKPEQQEAVDKLQSGMILVANTGAGKSRTGIYWYFKENGGAFINDDYQPMKDLWIFQQLQIHFKMSVKI